MKQTDFNGMCQLSSEGHLIWVENSLNHVKGRVVGCDTTMIEVEVGNHCEKWEPSQCHELTHGYRVKYDMLNKYPHEYDTHLD